MRFNSHSAIAGKHALLGASNYHWINYTDQKLIARYYASHAAAQGTALHELAHSAIRLKVKLGMSDKTLAQYVRDGIKFEMTCEQPLYYSDNCFGTPDTISFRKNFLRIHDLKTGLTKTSMTQLYVYVALFCLEYGLSPFDIEIELRIYQNGEILIEDPDRDAIIHIMDRIITFDKKLQELKEGEFG